MISLRCSDLPLALACPAAVLDGGLRVSPSHPAAADGTAAHAALARLVEAGGVDWDGLPDLCAIHGADPDEVRVLVAQGARLWADVRGYFPHPRAEVALRSDLAPGVELTGHVDALGAPSPFGGVVFDSTSGQITIADWKTGRIDAEHRNQVFGYAALVLFADPYVEMVDALVLWVRDGEIERHRIERHTAAAWTVRLVETVERWRPGDYRPGPQCGHCPRAHDCPGARALVRRDAAALTGAEGDAVDLDSLPPSAAVDLYATAGRMAAVADRVKAAVKARVERDGDLVGDGVRLTVQTSERRDLDAIAAWPVLQSRLDDTEIAGACRVSAGAVEKAVAAKARRGKGAAAARELAQALDAAGAVRRVEVRTLVTRRLP